MEQERTEEELREVGGIEVLLPCQLHFKALFTSLESLWPEMLFPLL